LNDVTKRNIDLIETTPEL